MQYKWVFGVGSRSCSAFEAVGAPAVGYRSRFSDDGGGGFYTVCLGDVVGLRSVYTTVGFAVDMLRLIVVFQVITVLQGFAVGVAPLLIVWFTAVYSYVCWRYLVPRLGLKYVVRSIFQHFL